MPDHNTPTHDQDKPIEDPVSRKQVDRFVVLICHSSASDLPYGRIVYETTGFTWNGLLIL